MPRIPKATIVPVVEFDKMLPSNLLVGHARRRSSSEFNCHDDCAGCHSPMASFRPCSKKQAFGLTCDSTALRRSEPILPPFSRFTISPTSVSLELREHVGIPIAVAEDQRRTSTVTGYQLAADQFKLSPKTWFRGRLKPWLRPARDAFHLDRPRENGEHSRGTEAVR